MKGSDVTIIVLNWNRKAETLACVASLQAANLHGAAVLVVDNGSRDGSAAAIRAAFPTVGVLELPENRGYAGGNNAGIRVALDAGAEAVLLLNNDAIVAPDFIEPLLEVAQEPGIAAVSSAIFRMDRPEMLDVAYSEVHLDRRDAVQIRGVNALPGEGFDTRREVDVGIGCSLLMTTHALRTIGLFDEAYFAYHEEVDWCMRARRAGLRIIFEPYSRVFHRGGTSTLGLRQPPRPDPNAPQVEQLPNAEPPPWNPVRAYLGARNITRLLRSYATRAEKRSFAWAVCYEVPLQYLAIIMNMEGWMTLGRWSYPEMVRHYFIRRHPVLTAPAAGAGGLLRKVVALLVLVPFDVLWSLPRDAWRAHRLGRTGQFSEYVRGLIDGWLNRPLPLERLGLR